MAEAKERLGKLPCTHCGEPTQVKRNAAGTLTMTCDECGWSTFARRGDKANHDLVAKLEKPAPGPSPDPVPAPIAAPKPAREAFSLGGLK